MELHVSVSVDQLGRHRLTAAGALDLASRKTLVASGAQLLTAPGTTALVVDLSGIRFCDSSGLGALIELAGDAADRDVPFSLANPTARIVRLLDTAGLRDAWPVVED